MGPEFAEFMGAVTTLFLCVGLPGLIGISVVVLIFAIAYRMVKN